MKMKEHYYTEEPKSQLKLRKIRARLRNNELEFWTGAGVFSGKKVDKGSELLANDCIINKGWKVLDLGCGYGPVGIAVAKAYPSSTVVLTDINKRAAKLARMNKKLDKLSNVSVVQGDMYEKVPGLFDTILLNPPQTAGKEICFKMIELAPKFLKKNGLMQVVARHNKGGKHLAEKMKSVFGNVKEISKKSGYRIYLSKN
jgi:16S rRNA G1207 methylase RsmC